MAWDGLGWWRTAAVTAVLFGLVAAGEGAGASSGRGVGGAITLRVSVGSSGQQANGDGYSPAVSADGRYVAFVSGGSNLAAGDTNSAADVFVRDRVLGVTRRVSVSSSGQQGNSYSFTPAISPDGRFVVFESFASNLVAGDTNDCEDVFVRDRQRGVTRRVSVSSSGQQGNGDSYTAAVSADGRFVVFESSAMNLVAGDTMPWQDVFVRDRQRGVTRRVSVSSSGQQGNGSSSRAVISADGRFVGFVSDASNLVVGDTNGTYDVFVRDRVRGVTRRVSVSASGQQANGESVRAAISSDGRYVVFESFASNLVAGDTNDNEDVFVRDRQRGVTWRASVSSTRQQANGQSYSSAISADGRFVTFASDASNLVAGDTNDSQDVFLRDRIGDVTRRVSVSSSGQQADGYSFFPAISADGRYVTFESSASNLVRGDTNGVSDVFVRGRR